MTVRARRVRRALCCALVAFSCATSTQYPAPPGPLMDAPIDLVLPTIGGPPLDVAELRGHVVLIDVMATWSLASQAQLPTWRRLLAAFDRDLKVVSVAMDSQTPQLVRTYVEALAVTWPVALATPEVLEGRSPLGRIPEIPRTLILDRRGLIRFDHSGVISADVLAHEIESVR